MIEAENLKLTWFHPDNCICCMLNSSCSIDVAPPSSPQPFWPMGTGCARGFLAAFDTAWMVNSWAQGQTVLDVLAERYCD